MSLVRLSRGKKTVLASPRAAQELRQRGWTDVQPEPVRPVSVKVKRKAMKAADAPPIETDGGKD